MMPGVASYTLMWGLCHIPVRRCGDQSASIGTRNEETDVSAPAKSLRVETSVQRSLLIYLALMAYLVLVKVILELGSVKAVVPSQAGFFSWPMIGFLALAGGFCVWLAPRTGLPDLWDPNIPPRKWLLLPAVLGLAVGGVNLALEATIGTARMMAEAGNVASINVPFPASFWFYSGGAIIVEVLYRLILITLPLWLIANVILRKRGQAAVFWGVALVTSLAETAGLMSVVAGHLDMMLFVGVATYGLNILEAYLFWRRGALAPLVFRFCFYFVWHVVASAIGI